MSEIFFGFLLSIIATIFFGLNNIFISRGLKTDKLTEGIFITLIFSTLIIFIFTLITGEFSQILSLNIEAWFLYIGTGFVNFVLGRTFNYTGITLLGPSRASAIVSTQILFSVFFAFVFLAESIDLVILIGVLFAFIGIVLVSLSQEATKAFNFRGLLFAFLTAFFVGLAIVMVRSADLLSDLPIDGALISYFTAVVIYIPGVFIKKTHATTNFLRSSLLILVSAGILSGLAQIARFVALKLSPVVLVASIIATSPLVTMVFSFFINKKYEILNRKLLIGAIITVIGIILVSLFTNNA